MNSDAEARLPGHSVLVIPVPELNGWVRERTAHYDPSFLGSSSDFINAHITLLGPWLPAPTASDLAVVAEIAARSDPFDFTLSDLRTFPDGLIYLAPEPSEPFVTLTERLTAAFPDYPPYGGAFGSVVPHLTVDQAGAEVRVTLVEDSLGDLIPLTSKASRIDLQWWENDRCRLMATWAFNS